ncbi:MAG: hypothetical protein FJY66_03220 [Calditrichaeota bacterium]|nr:hypothetical protein [Calditrichota bacterium]
MSASKSRSSAVRHLFARFEQPLSTATLRVAASRIALLILCAGLCILAATWKNIEVKRVSIELAQSNKVLSELRKERLQLMGEIKAISSYPRIASWAREKHGWTISTGLPNKILLSRQDLNPSARRQWDIRRVRDE